MSPLVQVLRQALIRVLDPTVQVAYLVVVHLIQIPVVEVLGETLAESHGEEFAKVFHGRVDGGRRYREKHQTQYLHADTRMSQKQELTLRTNSSKFLLTIACTILPWTSASQIVRKVRTTRSPVSTTR